MLVTVVLIWLLRAVSVSLVAWCFYAVLYFLKPFLLLTDAVLEAWLHLMSETVVCVFMDLCVSTCDEPWVAYTPLSSATVFVHGRDGASLSHIANVFTFGMFLGIFM